MLLISHCYRTPEILHIIQNSTRFQKSVPLPIRLLSMQVFNLSTVCPVVLQSSGIASLVIRKYRHRYRLPTCRPEAARPGLFFEGHSRSHLISFRSCPLGRVFNMPGRWRMNGIPALQAFQDEGKSSESQVKAESL
jgi:hypothetical protein